MSSKALVDGASAIISVEKLLLWAETVSIHSGMMSLAQTARRIICKATSKLLLSKFALGKSSFTLSGTVRMLAQLYCSTETLSPLVGSSTLKSFSSFIIE